jgi:hypothetical protein
MYRYETRQNNHSIGTGTDLVVLSLGKVVLRDGKPHALREGLLLLQPRAETLRFQCRVRWYHLHGNERGRKVIGRRQMVKKRRDTEE